VIEILILMANNISAKARKYRFAGLLGALPDVGACETPGQQKPQDAYILAF
jgi:hypothetical protein